MVLPSVASVLTRPLTDYREFTDGSYYKLSDAE